MAKTIKIAKYVKEPRGLDRQTVRRGSMKPSGLYLLELRSHVAESQSALPKRKLTITIKPAETQDLRPKPVKITHT
jgi:hypothetical protein